MDANQINQTQFITAQGYSLFSLLETTINFLNDTCHPLMTIINNDID